MASVCFRFFFIRVDLVLDVLHSLLGLLCGYLLSQINLGDFCFRLSFDSRCNSLRFSLLFFDLLFLLCNVEKCFLCFNLFIVFHQTFWYLWLGDSNTNDFNTRSPSSCTLRQCIGQLLVKSVKFVNEDVLESVFTAELVDLMVNLIKNPRFVVVDGVVLDSFLGKLLFESVHHFDLLEHYVDSARGTARNVIYFVCLHGYLNVFDGGDERKHEVPTRLLVAVQYGATPEVDSNVAFLDSVHT